MFRGDGPVEEYEWRVSDGRLADLLHLIPNHFRSKYLLIACFDSGPIKPTEEESQLGWRETNGGLLSPPLKEAIFLPSEQFDEWWIFDDRAAAERLPEYDPFVNQTSWTLCSPEELQRDFDPTWERGHFDALVPLQETFWRMLAEHRPLAVISDGDRLVIASRDRRFLKAFDEYSDA